MDKPSFLSFSIFSFFFLLPTLSSVPEIVKELCSFSYSLHFGHLSFNNIMKKAFYSENLSNPLTFLRRMLFRNALFSPIRSRTCSLVTFSDNIISSVLLQHHSLKLSKYFLSNFLQIMPTINRYSNICSRIFLDGFSNFLFYKKLFSLIIVL